MNTEIVERLERSFQREDFEKLQDVMTWGILKVMRVAADVARYLPRGSPWLRELELAQLSDDELAKRIAEAKAAEQMGQAQKQPKPPDFKVSSPHEDTSEQPATDKREDSK
jgi:hypothetical protein